MRSIRLHFIKKISILGILLFVFDIAYSQTKNVVSGKIIDSTDKSSLIGASVVIKGTSSGTISDIDGNYTLNVNSLNDTLIFSFIGYMTQEIPINGQNVINISLKPDIAKIDEIVVVGYGTQKKEDLTGAISVISEKDMKKANADNMSKALQGRAAGVTVMSVTGQPGASMNIRVRGAGSINNKAQPIVVIDGIITSTAELTNLNPKDIASISVLKDAASASIYGAQSSNGVILVKTKKGEAGKPKIQFNAQIGLSNVPKQMDIMTADEYVDFYRKAYDTNNLRFKDYPQLQKVFPEAYTDSVRAIYGYPNTDWQDLITVNNALSQNYNLSMSGGTEKITSLFSGTYNKTEGILLNTSREIATIRINTSYKLSKRIRVGENLSISVDKIRQSNGDAHSWLMSSVSSPLMPVYNENNEKGYMGPSTAVTGNNDRTNPYAELMLYEGKSKTNRFFGDVFAEWEIIKGLTFKTVFGFNYSNTLNSSWLPKYDLGQRSNPTATLKENPYYYERTQLDEILSYANSINGHNFTVIGGHSAIDISSNSIYASARDFNWEDLRTLSNGKPDLINAGQDVYPETLESYFARVTYDYKGKYLFTGTFRRDGSSKFGPNNRWGNFPAFSVGWKINEDFMKSVDFINTLKLRLGWGKSGNLPDAGFLYNTYLSTYDAHVYTFGNDVPTFGVAPFYSFGSPDIQWEEAIMSNIGFDLNMMNNRIEISAEYYDKRYEKLLTYYPLKVVFGLSNDANPPVYNYGNMKNSGVEINIIFKKHTGKFNYDIGGNIATVNNKITDLPINGEVHYNTTITLVDQTVGAFYGFVAERLLDESDFKTDNDGNLIYDSEGRYIPVVPMQQDYTGPGDIKFKDLNKDGIINDNDKTIIGKSLPDFTYGLNFDFNYLNLDLNLFFFGVQNVDVYNAFRSRGGLAAGDVTSKDENKLVDVNNYWTSDNPVDDQTGIGLSDFNNNARFSSWWLEDASFLRLKNVQFGYTLPEKILKSINISNCRLYVGGENVFVITKYKGYDPEVSSTNILQGNVDYGRYPIPRVFTFGISANF
jgi:TonB-linked SusC/RagA family outer membrane protein